MKDSGGDVTPVEIPHRGGEAAYNLERAHLSLPAVLSIIGAIVGVVVSFTISWSKTAHHVDDAAVHLNAEETRRGGGVAFKNDVRELRDDIKWQVVATDKKIRHTLRSVTITCRKTPSGMGCRIELPEESE